MATSPQVRAIGYGRLSRTKGGIDDSVSIQIQKMDYEAFCKSKGYVSDGWFADDGVSGGKVSRPQWDALVRAADGHVLVSRDLSRIGRTVEMLALLNKLATDDKITGIEFTSGGSPGTGYMARQTIGFMMVSAQAEREAVSERMKRRLAFNRANGEPQTGGKRPFGTLTNKRTPVPEEVERIIEACRYVSSGGTLGTLAAKWSDEGVRTSVGGVWTFQKLRSLLVNERLDALVGAEIARPCRQTIEGRHKTRTHSVVLTRWLRDVLVCGLCGARLDTHASGGKKQYSCLKPEGCGKIVVSAERTESLFADFLLKIVLPMGGETDEVEQTNLINARAETVGKIARNNEMYEDGTKSKADHRKRYDELSAQLQGIDRSLSEMSASAGLYGIMQTEGADGIETAWPSLTPQQKRSIAQMHLGSVTVGPNTTPGRFDLARFTFQAPADLWWKGYVKITLKAV